MTNAFDDQKRHEIEIYEAFLDWLIRTKGISFHFNPFFDELTDECRNGCVERYLENIQEYLEEYVKVTRGYPEQPIWCARHHMQTCHKCLAFRCGDNLTPRDTNGLLHETANALIGEYLHHHRAPPADLNEVYPSFDYVH